MERINKSGTAEGQVALENKSVLIEVQGALGLLTINRPSRLNALNQELLDELSAALTALEGNAEVRVVVITGAGEKSFVAGGDIREMMNLDPKGGEEFSRKGQEVLLKMERMSKPVIAAVNGYALGGGLELAMACDFIYASENAVFGLPEVTLGVIPGFGGTQNLSRLVGPNKAREMIFSGSVLSAQQAVQWGIVNQVFPANDLLVRVKEIAQRIALHGGRAIAAAKQAIRTGLDLPKEEGFHQERSLFASLFATEDQKEGMQAFIEKRTPIFRNR